MHRFYCPNIDFSPQKISIINSGEIHHLTRVLRMGRGDQLELFNGQGEEAVGIIESISSLEVSVLISERRHKRKISASVILACAVPKKAKFESIIEKCTELGVDEIIPMRTERTEVILKDERLARKNTRYQTVAINAAKQSGRATVPVVHAQRSFKEILSSFEKETLRIIPCLAGERKSLREVLQDAKGVQQIVFLIGPEGDFTKQELTMALNEGVIAVTLGETTLKVDTAAITAVGFTRVMLGDY